MRICFSVVFTLAVTAQILAQQIELPRLMHYEVGTDSIPDAGKPGEALSDSLMLITEKASSFLDKLTQCYGTENTRLADAASRFNSQIDSLSAIGKTSNTLRLKAD